MRTPLRLSFLAVLLALAPAGFAQDDFDDEELLHVFITANQGEIMTSRPLLDDLGDEEVRQYAQQMVDAHSRVLEQAEALDIDPEDNPISMSMTRIASGKADRLDDLEAPMLDARYLEAQIVLHGHSLDMLDFVLIPNADDDAFRTLLEQTRPHVEMHLRRAEQLAHRMMAEHGMMSDDVHGDMDHGSDDDQ